MKKAFTLVELLGVIIVLAVIALITFPIIDNSIQKSRQSALERTIENIERAAYSYSVEYDLGYSAEQQVLELSELISKGFISKEEHINPVTDEELKGCVLYNWDETKKQYKFEYADPCEVIATLPTMTLAYDNNYINGNGWINRNIMVSLNGTGSKFYYCLSDSECDPIIEENKPNGTKILTNEGTNVICAKAVNSHGESDVVCTEELKIDKTPPTIGSITVNGTKGSNDWYTTDVSINVTNGSDALSGHDKTVSSVTEINRNTQGTMVYVVTTDLAGNSATNTFNIKVDKNYPTLIAKSGDVTITQGDSNPTINYFTYNYSISGGSISCEPSNTNSLEDGTKTITCTAIGGNGLITKTNKNIQVKSKNLHDELVKLYDENNSVGLLKDSLGVYYFKGTNTDVTNNYVLLGDHIWRVLEFEYSNGTILLISENDVGSVKPTSVWTNEEEYISNPVNVFLNTTFYNSLSEQVKKKITKNYFSIQFYYDNNEITTYQNVGLLSYEQYNKYGSYASDKKTIIGNPYDSQYLSFVDHGVWSRFLAINLISVRPVIRIYYSIILGGDGSLENPYILKT